MEDFGVIVICCDQDYFMAKGVCASIRHFLGDVPICLLVDGTFSVADAQKAYGAKVINRMNMTHDVLKQRSFGWGTTRMIAFWESPFKHFLLVDADVIIWGNILKYANFKDYDVIIDRPCSDYSREAVQEYFFDIPVFEANFPGFNWQNRPFVCPAVLFGTRDIFTLEEYIEILDFKDKHPNVFKYGDMGFLNYMIFRAADQGRLRLGQEDIQFLVPDFPQEHAKKRFPMNETGPVVVDDEANVVHWCGPKPTLSSSNPYSEPMNFFRRKFLRDASGTTGLAAEALLQVEDLQRNIYVYKKKIRKKLTGKY
ncbi:hypothetical protein H6F77_17575 [Microcoleus sp. FACHB-831]|uniref:hypothetical protein n=1 Tax=Microcoleus sp. FACHB-831 TaxID=2692827 RepID=UPI0016864AD7|nr:hypothetical protein [Microcoleus sp. FACHB-831]MBD1922865.1 hypothetical protein [Microcoleus sp. FACHB-831]